MAEPRFDAFSEAGMAAKGIILNHGPKYEDHSGEEEVAGKTAKEAYVKTGKVRETDWKISTGGTKVEDIPDTSIWGGDPAETYEARQAETRGEEEGEVKVVDEEESLNDSWVDGLPEPTTAEILEGVVDEDIGRLTEEKQRRLEKIGIGSNEMLGRAIKLGRSQGKPGTGDRPRQVPKYKTEGAHLREKKDAA